MDSPKATENQRPPHRTRSERTSDRELVTTRTFNAPAHLVFQAWTTPELFQRWWVPKAFGLTLLSYTADIRVGGTYRLVFSHPAAPEPMAFFGTYLEVTPHTRLVWTNEEGGEQGQVTTVTFAESDGQTLLTVHECYPSKEALDETIASDATGALPEQFEQLDVILTDLVASAGQA
ncbi:MAG: SRPBCC family protein [Candidatus Sericytochromatia bacterium]